MAFEKKNDTSINEWINEQDAPLHYFCIVDAPVNIRLQKIEAALKGGRDYLVNELDHSKDPEQNRDNRAIIDLLIKYGADPEIQDVNGRSAIDLCSSNAQDVPEPILSLLREILPRLEYLNERYATDRNQYGVPLHNIPYIDRPIGFRWPMFKAAIDAGYNVNEVEEPAVRRSMNTPLHCAVTFCSAGPNEHLEIVKLLLAQGADPRIKGKRGGYTSIDEVQMSIRGEKNGGRDSSDFETYLKLMEDAARKLNEKEAREKEGPPGFFKRAVGWS